MFRRKLIATVLCLSLSSACGTQRPAMVQAFPQAPVDLKSALPVLTPLPEKATLSAIMAAHLSDVQAFGDLRAEVIGWRQWWQAQADAMKK